MLRIGMIVTMLVVTGCAAGSGGGSAGPAAPTTLALPSRPYEVRIEGVDPCSLLTEQQRAELGLDGEPSFASAPSGLFGGEEPACVTLGFNPRAVVAGVSVVTTAGVELFTSGKLEATVTALEVQKFPAVLAVPDRFSRFCSVLIDVAPGQLLNVQYSDGGRKPPIPQDRLCRDAQDVANAAMMTLLRR